MLLTPVLLRSCLLSYGVLGLSLICPTTAAPVWVGLQPVAHSDSRLQVSPPCRLTPTIITMTQVSAGDADALHTSKDTSTCIVPLPAVGASLEEE